MIISIDGPSGSGKSTVADLVSKKLGFIHFNSGSLFRGVTAFFMSKNADFSKIKTETILEDFVLDSDYVDGVQHVYVNGIDFTNKLRDNQVSILTPVISSCRFVRNKIDNFQRNYAKTHNIVMDGRDIGSHVFPNAEFKFYLDCSLEERANRRYKEELEKNSNVTYEEIKQQLFIRDETDKNKKIAPLIVPEGAIIIDSTHLNIEQVVNAIYNHIKL